MYLNCPQQVLSRLVTHPKALQLAQHTKDLKISEANAREEANELEEVIQFIKERYPSANVSEDEDDDDDRETGVEEKLEAASSDREHQPPSPENDVAGGSAPLSSSEADGMENDWTARGDQPLPEDELGSTASSSGSWWSEFVTEEDYAKMDHSGKLVLLMDILRQCELIGDKVLVFSQSLVTLDLIEAILAAEDAMNKETRAATNEVRV